MPKKNNELSQVQHPELENAPHAELDRIHKASGNATLAELESRTQADGPQCVDGSRWIWQLEGTPDGGTVVAAADGGVWQREFSGALEGRWFGVVGNGETDDTAAVNCALDATAVKRGRTLNLRGLTMRVSDRILVPNNTTVLLDGSVFYVAPDQRTDNWIGVLVSREWQRGGTGDNFHLRGNFLVDCNVPDEADETAPDRGSTAYVQRGAYIANSKHWSIDGISVNKPLKDGIRITDGSTIWRLRVGTINHRDGWTRNNDGSRRTFRQARPCLHISSPQSSETGTLPGSNGFIPSMTREKSLAATTGFGWIDGGEYLHGTHGLLFTNVTGVKVSGTSSHDNSHRGINLSPTSDRNTFTNCHTINSGSTGIHLANGSSYNTFTSCTVNGVLSGEGDGVKCYVGCIGNTFNGLTVEGAWLTGVRFAFGSCRNVLTGLTIIAPEGTYIRSGSAGIKIMSRTRTQANAYAEGGYDVQNARCIGNVVSSVTVHGYRSAVFLGYETPTYADAPTPSADNSGIYNNIIDNINIENCRYIVATHDERAGYDHDAKSRWFGGNSLTNIRARGASYTQLSGNTPTIAYFSEIANVQAVGGKWGTLPLVQRVGGKAYWAAPGAPNVSVANNGDVYTDTSTGKQYHRINDEWRQLMVMV